MTSPMQEVFANQLAPGPVLVQPLTSTATLCVVSNPADFPVLSTGQFFRMSIQNVALIGGEYTPTGPIEIVLVTGQNGSTFTIQRGVEGSIANNYAPGAIVGNTLTAQAMRNLSPSFAYQTSNGNFTWPLDANGMPYKKVILTQQTPGAAAASLNPQLFIPGQTYILVDGALIAETEALTLVPQTGEFINNTPSTSEFQLSSNGQAVEFATDGINFWVE